jgi:type I thyroxine 5'-deiodinase
MWQLPSNLKDNVVFATPKDFDERDKLAGACVRKLGLQLPALIDGLDNAVERAYTAWPDRLYVIDRNGKVTYKSTPGPFGFKPDAARTALQKAL